MWLALDFCRVSATLKLFVSKVCIFCDTFAFYCAASNQLSVCLLLYLLLVLLCMVLCCGCGQTTSFVRSINKERETMYNFLHFLAFYVCCFCLLLLFIVFTHIFAVFYYYYNASCIHNANNFYFYMENQLFYAVCVCNMFRVYYYYNTIIM